MRTELGAAGHTVSSTHLSAIDLLGTRVEGTFTAEEAMEKAFLAGWNVRKVPAYAVVSGMMIEKPGVYDVIRNNPQTGNFDVLSRYNVGESYSTVQNEEHAGFLNAMVEESGANFELAGTMDEGRKVFLSMKLPGHIKVGGVDPVGTSLFAINSHDGSMSFTIGVLPVRYACSNVINSLWNGSSGLIRIRHTSGAQKNIVLKAREALDLSFKHLEGFQEQAEVLINKELTQSRFEEIVEREFGPKEDSSPAAITRAEKRVEQIAELFADAQTQEGIRSTAWAGYNALTEWADHYSPTRGNHRDESRAQKAILDPRFKTRALELMLAA
jgi:phage/plasmid-like protein (TIGR03299 family)